MLACHAGIWLPRGYESKTGCRDQADPRIFRRPKRYCCGALPLSQVAIADMLKRTTASSYEQK